jgi:hypothetical protein
VKKLTTDAGSFDFQERVVAFADVLGFAELVEASYLNAAERAKISKLICTNDLFQRFAGEILDFAEATFFSDSFVLSMRADRVFYMIRETGYLCRHLLMQGFLTRGAIALGALHHRNPIVVGPAFVNAYRLEQSVAFFPRVVLDDATMEVWREEFASESAHPHLESLIKRDRDGQHFIDIFSPSWNEFLQWTEFVRSDNLIPHDHASFVRAANEHVQNGLMANIGRPKIRAKYEWLATECTEGATLPASRQPQLNAPART